MSDTLQGVSLWHGVSSRMARTSRRVQTGASPLGP